MAFIPNTDRNREEMLREIGVSRMEELLEALPDDLRLRRALNLPGPLSVAGSAGRDRFHGRDV